MSYVERLIFSALSDGMVALRKDPRQLVALFRQNGLERLEAEALRDAFLIKAPAVIHGYPREDSPMPLFAIILGDERESQLFLSNTGGQITLEEAQSLGLVGEAGADTLTSIYTHEYNIWTVTISPDQTIAFYEVAKYILTLARPDLINEGLAKITLSGADYAPDSRYLPANLFVRRLTFTCEAEERFIDPGTAGRIRSVDGIFVDDGSDETRTGRVETLVTPYEETPTS